jgi:heme exporter protein B
MKNLKQIIILIKKDFKVELRRKEGLTLGLGLSFMLAALIALAFQGSFLNFTTKINILPALFWIVFLFSAVITASRSYEHDYQHSVLQYLLVQGVNSSNIYISKLVSIFFTSIVIFYSGVLGLVLFWGLDFPKLDFNFNALVLITIMCFSALAGICEPLTRKSNLKNLLFPLVFLPLMFPIFLIAIELSIQILNNQGFSWNNPLVTLLILCTLVYSLLGIKLSEFVFYE